MAEIHVERKAAVWPWILGIMAVILVVGLIAWGTRDEPAAPVVTERVVEPGDPVAPTTGVAPATMQEYYRFAGITNGYTPPEVGREHEYTSEGLRRLAGALDELTAAHPEAARPDQIQSIRRAADAVQRDPHSLEHARMVREAFGTAAEVIGAVRPVEERPLRDQAESISPQRPLLEQHEQVQTFFQRSAEAIRRANAA